VDDPNTEHMIVLFHDLLTTMHTLFMSVTGGLNWQEVQVLLLEISVYYALAFLLFILVTSLAVMNVITGIFVTDAVEVARLDADIKVQQATEESRKYLRNLNELFHQIDTNHRGSITLDDFTKQMNREDVKLNFAMLGLDATDAVSFFSLLDVDGRVELEIDEFVMGCMRFRGSSSTVNLECSILEAKQLMVKSLVRQKRMQEKLSILGRDLQDICTALESNIIVHGRKAIRVQMEGRQQPRTPVADGTHSRIDKESFNLGEDRDEPSLSNDLSAST